MPKQSAKDELIARIDADMDRIAEVVNYVGGDGTEALMSRVNADITHLKAMRNYVTANGSASAPADKPKRTRGKGKRGLPTTANVDGV